MSRLRIAIVAVLGLLAVGLGAFERGWFSSAGSHHAPKQTRPRARRAAGKVWPDRGQAKAGVAPTVATPGKTCHALCERAAACQVDADGTACPESCQMAVDAGYATDKELDRCLPLPCEQLAACLEGLF